jgi:ankyrin repeat protein
MEKQFIQLCRIGNLDNIIHFYENNSNINISSDNELAFRVACENGHFEIAKWLLSISPNIDIHTKDSYAFCYSCESGYLEIAKWLFSLNPNISLYDYECSFCYSCESGQFEVVKWLFSINPNLNISNYREYAFRYACKNGHLEVVKWLLSIKPDINISIKDNYAFCYACENDHLELAKWFTQLDYKYCIEIDEDDDKIVSYYISKSLPMVNNVNINMDTIHEKICPICYEATVLVQTNCFHNYCLECLTTHYNTNNTCPYCRRTITHCYNITS